MRRDPGLVGVVYSADKISVIARFQGEKSRAIIG
jgi:hypothetical protein